MANEIYDVTWWGDAPNTARSLENSYENALILGGQLEMQKRIESESGTQENTICASNKLHNTANI